MGGKPKEATEKGFCWVCMGSICSRRQTPGTQRLEDVLGPELYHQFLQARELRVVDYWQRLVVYCFRIRFRQRLWAALGHHLNHHLHPDLRQRLRQVL